MGNLMQPKSRPRWPYGMTVRATYDPLHPDMVVVMAGDKGIRCRWRDESGKQHEKTYAASELTRVVTPV